MDSSESSGGVDGCTNNTAVKMRASTSDYCSMTNKKTNDDEEEDEMEGAVGWDEDALKVTADSRHHDDTLDQE